PRIGNPRPATRRTGAAVAGSTRNNIAGAGKVVCATRGKIVTYQAVKRLASTTLLLLLFAAAGQAQPTSVILISADTLRADHLSAYGYTRVHTPNMDSFAERGTLFTQADCQVPLTLPSHTSLFTSTYPFENQVEENAERVPQDAKIGRA